jgi:hypothetical protein
LRVKKVVVVLNQKNYLRVKKVVAVLTQKNNLRVKKVVAVLTEITHLPCQCSQRCEDGKKNICLNCF